MKIILNLFNRRKKKEDTRKKSNLQTARELAEVLVADINFRQTMQLTRGKV